MNGGQAMKRVVYSRYQAGDLVVLKKDCGQYMKGHRFVVDDPRKTGSDRKIKVHDPMTNVSAMFPSKYLSDIK